MGLPPANTGQWPDPPGPWVCPPPPRPPASVSLGCLQVSCWEGTLSFLTERKGQSLPPTTLATPPERGGPGLHRSLQQGGPNPSQGPGPQPCRLQSACLSMEPHSPAGPLHERNRTRGGGIHLRQALPTRTPIHGESRRAWGETLGGSCLPSTGGQRPPLQAAGWGHRGPDPSLGACVWGRTGSSNWDCGVAPSHLPNSHSCHMPLGPVGPPARFQAGEGSVLEDSALAWLPGTPEGRHGVSPSP